MTIHVWTRVWISWNFGYNTKWALCDIDINAMIILKLIVVKYSLTSYLSYTRHNLGIMLNNCLSTTVSIFIAIVMCVCARACVYVWGRTCLSVFCVPAGHVMKGCGCCFIFFYVIYNRTIASTIAGTLITELRSRISDCDVMEWKRVPHNRHHTNDQ